MKKIILISILIIISVTIFLILFANNKNEENEKNIKTKQVNNKKIKSKILNQAKTNKLDLMQKTNVVLNLVDKNKHKKLKWNEKTVRTYINSIKPPNRYKYVDNRIINIITNTAIANNINVPTNIIDFTQFILEFPSTNYNSVWRVLDIIHGCTNEILGKFLLLQFTNYYGEKYMLPGWEGSVNRSDPCLWAIRTIGTPELMDNLNKAWLEMRKNDRRYPGPGETIEPDRFPKESEDWLFNSTYCRTREIMVTEWLECKRPERVDVLRKYIKKLENTDKMDPYFTHGWPKKDKPYLKKIVIDQLKERVDNIENSIKSNKKNSKNTERAKKPMVPKALRRLNHRYKPPKRNGK